MQISNSTAQEINLIRNALVANRYLNNSIRRCLRTQSIKESDEQQFTTIMFLLQARRTTDGISKTIGKYIKILIEKKIGDILNKPKYKIHLEY